jgi:uncharacterized protein YbjT (DUF2867 family)
MIGSALDGARKCGSRARRVRPFEASRTWIGMLVVGPLRQGAPVTLVGPGDHRHTFVSQRDVIAFTAACVNNPAAIDRTLVIAGPDALDWRDVVRTAERVADRQVEVRFIAPGEQLPGFPPVVSEPATALETNETVIDARDVAAAFGVRLTRVEDYLRATLPQ